MPNEDLIQFIWNTQSYKRSLLTTDKQDVQVIHQGEVNSADGPDFFNAKVRIGDKLWAGNVEVHTRSSDWLKHGHSENKKYRKLILHVVYFHDVEIDELIYEKVPTVELSQFFDLAQMNKLYELTRNNYWIPCEKEITKISFNAFDSWQKKLLHHRINRKVIDLKQVFTSCEYNWEQAFYTVLLTSYGLKSNSTAMDLLAKRLPYSVLLKERRVGREYLEAIVFGVSGFLPSRSNHFYVNRLIDTFSFQKKKYKIEPMTPDNWKRGGVRPGSQPFVRLVQLTTFLFNAPENLMDLLSENMLVDLKGLFNSKHSEYWRSHIFFEQPRVNGINRVGKSMRDLILINGMLPFLYFYGDFTKNDYLKKQSVSLYDQLPGEKSKMIENWRSLGVNVKTAAATQGLIELKNEYCSQKKCLFCDIGNQILCI